ncbi:MAG: di-trans,poly-cis-decaprenylcistransferase [Gammaproteobacteria bacterium]|nr:MAG: di-trans,poly-cis-decaprenylcistransferase [Gammaproteobacteria bacterium]
MNADKGSDNHLPHHLSIIMDGNGRWAKQKKIPRVMGHKNGIDATSNAIEFCLKENIAVLSIYAFSSENWQRPKNEVRLLMGLFLDAIDKHAKQLHINNVKIIFIGDISVFQDPLKEKIKKLTKLTKNNDKLILNIAMNYGGQQEIIIAVNKILQENKHKKITIEQFDKYLDLDQIAKPDLLIRSGGERRLSNFLLYHLAYTEIYFSDILWPDVDDKVLYDACDFYKTRQRRYGKIAQQITANN